MRRGLQSVRIDRPALAHALAGACCPAAISFAGAGLAAEQLFVSELADENKLAEFPKFDVDGQRVDTDGRIFVARPDAGVVAIIVPPGSAGTAHADVPTKGSAPTNLTFGGADGRDVYVTQSQGGFVERFRTDRPGREPCLQTPAPPGCGRSRRRRTPPP
jgi:sugar lactone lactonase YvrE